MAHAQLPLQLAIMSGCSIEVVELLIERRADGRDAERPTHPFLLLRRPTPCL